MRSLLVLALSAAALVAQNPPTFEVATIKPSKSSGGVGIGVSPGGLFDTTNTSLSILIKFAYDLHSRQIVGGPSWLETDRYDVTGKPDKPGKPSLKQLNMMVQNLLADRFQLTFHRDKRELPVYAITIAKSGPKLIKNESDPNGLWGGAGIGARSLSLRNITMAEFASILQGAGSIVERPVVDQTGLGSARYDLTLKWTPDEPQPGDERRADNAAPPDLFTAFQQQLGLKLESTKAPVDVLVIDRVEKPSAN
jgi:uncharacterized protein (TIGR03435 family)